MSRLKDENNRDQCERYLGSHDAFIFVSPVLHLHAPASPRQVGHLCPPTPLLCVAHRRAGLQEKCIKDDDGHVFENADVTLGTRGLGLQPLLSYVGLIETHWLQAWRTTSFGRSSACWVRVPIHPLSFNAPAAAFTS